MIEKKNSFESRDYDVPFNRRINKKIYAKAIYDNFADTPDELAFKKGDILTVIEQDADGCEGWWLCTIRGRQGICPGNRLRIMNSYDSGCFSPSPASSPCPSLAASTATLNSSISSSEIYENSSIINSYCGNGNGSGSGCVTMGSPKDFQQLSQNHYPHQHQHQQQHQTHQHSHLQQQQQLGKRRSWHITPHKVITPQRHGDVYIYNNCTPPSSLHYQYQPFYQNQSTYQNVSMMSLSSEFETYDTPKPVTPVNYDCPKNWCRTPTLTNTFSSAITINRQDMMSTPVQEESYDVPRPLNNLLHHQNLMTPSSSNSSLLTSDSLSLSFSSSNRSSLANMPDYDIPRRNPIPIKSAQQQQHQQQQHLSQLSRIPSLSLQSPHEQTQLNNGNSQQINQNQQTNGTNQMAYDFPHPLVQSTSVQEKLALHQLATVPTKELPLELSSALETLARLHLEAATAITRLLSFVSPGWRVREKLEPVVMEVKLAAVRLRTALHDLTEFSEGALGNATRSEDRNLAFKLRPLVKALRDANKLIYESSETLNAHSGWNAEALSRKDDKSVTYPPDSLDQLIACAQTLIEDVRQTTSFIQGNAPLLFKRNVQDTHPVNGGSGEWLEDYDYVSFESKDVAAKKNSDLREVIPQNMKNNFDNVIKAAETATVLTAANSPIESNATTELNPNDKLLVRYYALQITTHMGNLRQAIDSFLETVEKNQPPKFFIAYGKFVVVSAHNLVTIGDIVHRNVSKQDLKDKILQCTDSLSDALKLCVTKSKKAAQQFPSVTAVQEMVDSVVDISHLASDLKTVMLQAVQLTF